MKTKDQALSEAYNKCKANAYFAEGFNAGIKYAQETIPVKEELPSKENEYINETVLVLGKNKTSFFWDLAKFDGNEWSKRSFTINAWRPVTKYSQKIKN